MMKLLPSKIQRKLLLILLCCSLLPLVLLGMVLYPATAGTIEKNMDSLYEVNVHELSLSLSLHVKPFLDLLQFNAASPNLQEALDLTGLSDIRREEICKQLHTELDSTNMITRINYPYFYLAIAKDQTVYTRYHSYDGEAVGIVQTKWYQQLVSSYKEAVWIGAGDSELIPGDAERIFVARNVSVDYENVGVLVYIFNRRFLSHQLDALNTDGSQSLFILDEENQCVAEGLKNAATYQRLAEQSFQWDQEELVLDGDKYMINTSQIPMDHVNQSWRVVMLTPLNVMYRQTKEIAAITATMMLMLFLVCITLIAHIQKWYVSPVLQLHSATQEIRKGNLSVTVHQPRDDELGELTAGFDEMTGSIRQSIRKIQEDERIKRKLELQVLQEQIRPHFISNTLNSIRIMADMRQAFGISKALAAFARLVEYYFRDTNQLTTVRNELEHLEEYVYLQNLRFQNRYELSCTVDDRLLSCQIPKLSLQPFVENCIQHGFTNLDKQGHICVEGTIAGERMLLTVSDDGIGIEPQRLEELFAPERLTQTGRREIGVGNVHRRIQAHFGDAYGIRATSQPGQGTCITLELPYAQQEGEK